MPLNITTNAAASAARSSTARPLLSIMGEGVRVRFRRPRSSTPDGVPDEVSGEASVGVRTPGETSSAARFAGDALMRRRV